MRVFGPFYPPPLQAAVSHAERLADLVSVEERSTGGGSDAAVAWLVGRSDEIERFVEQIVDDWRANRLGPQEAAAALDDYLAKLHDGLHSQLGIGAPACCFGSLTATARMAPLSAETHSIPVYDARGESIEES